MLPEKLTGGDLPLKNNGQQSLISQRFD